MDQSLQGQSRSETISSSPLRIIQASGMIYVIVGVGVLIRILTVMVLAAQDVPLQSDAFSYYEMAERIHQGIHYTPLWPPGLPYYLTLVFDLFGVDQVTARYAMIPFYVLMAAALYLLIQQAVSRGAANLSVLILTLYPTFIYHSVSTLTHLPVAAYLTLIIYLTYSLAHQAPSRQDWLKMALLGVIFSVMILTRAGSMTVLGVVPLYLFLKTRRVLPVAVPLVIIGVILSFYTVRVYQFYNELVIVNYANSYNLYLGNNPHTPLYRTWLYGSDVFARPPEVAQTYDYISSQPPDVQDQLYREEALKHITARPDLFVIRTLNRMRAYWGFDTFTGSRVITEQIAPRTVGLVVIMLDALFYYMIMVPAIAFFFLRRHISYAAKIPVMLVVGAVIFYAVPYFVAFSHATYHLPVMPLLAVPAAAVYNALPGWKWRRLKFTEIWREHRLLLFALAFFMFIQFEWAIVMASEFLST